MSKFSSSYVCQQCGYISPNYLGKCPECGSWNTLVEQVEESKKLKGKVKNLGTFDKSKIISIKNVEKQHYLRLSTNIDEFDRVLGGGIVKGSIVLVSGDPGIGKSTLLSHLALNLKNTLYIAGEESAHQIKLRLERIDPKADLLIYNEVDVDLIIEAIQVTRPSLVIIDSIQTLHTLDLESPPGAIGQVRESANRLQKIAKSIHIPIFLVGHVTKEGNIAGPKTLEHMVDVVLSLEGDPNSSFRVLRGNKNRFGPTDEIGVFDMTQGGMQEVKNPSKIFLENKVDAPGSAVAAILTGLRPMLLEIQALVAKSNLPSPRRVGIGLDNNRLQLLVAVLSKRLNLPLFDKDVFVSVVGGLKVFEPAADLAIAAAIISSLKDKTIPKNVCFVGEVGLLGEVRLVREINKRTKEAKKLSFTNIISSINAKNLAQAMRLALG